MTAPRFAVSMNHNAIPKRMADVRLRESFIALPSALPRGVQSLESHQSAFYNASRPAGECIQPKGHELSDIFHALLVAAYQTGDRRIIADTKVRIGRYCDLLVSRAEIGLPDLPPLPLALAADETERALADEMVVVARAGTTRNLTDLADAERQADVAIHSLEDFKASAHVAETCGFARHA